MIKTSTGRDKKNKPTAIAILQLLFNQVCIYQKNDPATGECTNELSGSKQIDDFHTLPNLSVDGKSIAPLIERIEAYQRAKKLAVIDGWISPSGKTIKALMKDAGITTGNNRMAFIRQSIISGSGVNIIKPSTVTNLYSKQYIALTNENKLGLEYILTTAKNDANVTSIPELAYMLATTKHETDSKFRAINEYGKGAGKAYGKAITVTHTTPLPIKASTTYQNKYFGRGYVQLTWGYNYQRIDEKLGNGSYPNKNQTTAAKYNTGFTISSPLKSVYLHPEKMLEKENAYVAMVYGMQKGIFTGKKVSDYINSSKKDYYNARRVINGIDKALAISTYAEDFEILLLLSTK